MQRNLEKMFRENIKVKNEEYEDEYLWTGVISRKGRHCFVFEKFAKNICKFIFQF